MSISRKMLLAQLNELAEVIADQVARDEAFAQRIAAVLAPAAPPPPPRNPAVLDPFAIYEQGWESMLRERLAPLSIEQLHDVIFQFGLDADGRLARSEDRRALVEFVVAAASKLS